MFSAPAISTARREEHKPYVFLEKGWWKLPTFYMISVGLFGLLFYPAFLVAVVFLLYQWRHDRYNFLIMFTLLWGGFGLGPFHNMPLSIPALLTAMVLWFVMRKPPILKKTLVVLLVYIGFLFIIALLSVESIKIQIIQMRHFWMILYIIVPFWVFSGHKFEFDVFLRKTFYFCLVMAMFYLLDAYIISGHIFVPNDSGSNGSTIFSPAIHPLSGIIYRIYPSGLYLYCLIFIPLIRSYRLTWWQWLLFIGSLVASQTFTIIMGFVVTFIIFQGGFKKLMIWGFGAVVFLVGIYVLDSFLPTQIHNDSFQSRLRVKSSVDLGGRRIIKKDDEDIAEFGSGRMAQALPKLDVVERENRQLIGLGFLHPEKTTLNQYIIENEYYSDVEASIEVSTAVEINQVQLYIYAGWLGLIVVSGLLLYLYYIIRKLPNAYYYLTVLCLNFMWGFGGFAGIFTPEGCMTIGISYAAIILSERERLPGFNCQWLKERRKRLF